MMMADSSCAGDVLRLADIEIAPLLRLFATQQLSFMAVEDAAEIPGSHWGDDEAGLIGDKIFARADTPVHSLLHEACHYFLMDKERRLKLHTDAGGTAVEENAVCYLQICLASGITGVGSLRMMQDMDAWGYSFRLGSARLWFEQDADDAIALLKQRGLWQQYRLEDCQPRISADG